MVMVRKASERTRRNITVCWDWEVLAILAVVAGVAKHYPPLHAMAKPYSLGFPLAGSSPGVGEQIWNVQSFPIWFGKTGTQNMNTPPSVMTGQTFA